MPYLKLFATDWLGDAKVRLCSLAARAVLLDILLLKHQCTPRGYLIIGGRPLSIPEIVGMVNGPPSEVEAALLELLDRQVVLKDDSGAIYSPRMVREEELSSTRKSAGKLGGNPSLVKQKVKQKVKQTPKQTVAMEYGNGNGIGSLNTGGAGGKPKREPDVVWDCVVSLWSMDATLPQHRTRIGKVVRDFKALAADPEQIAAAKSAYERSWKGVACTPEALVKHWGQFKDGRGPQPPGKLFEDIKVKRFEP